MEIRFTASVIEATNFMMLLTAGCKSVLPKDSSYETTEEMLGSYVKLSQPGWCNFDFFDRIKASPIRRTERVEPTPESVGSWRIERSVEFYLHRQLVARIHLVGMKCDGGNEDNDAMWAISKVGYFKRFDHANPEDWFEIKCRVTGLTGRWVEPSRMMHNALAQPA